jgi:hypothetical protein
MASLVAPVRNFPHHVDNGASKCGVFNAHERLGEGEPGGGCEEVGNIVWRTHFLRARCTRWSPWVFKEKRNRYPRAREICCSRLALMRFVPFSYFCTCWNVTPSASASLVWLIDSILRRMHTRLPTCRSVGLGDFVGIFCNMRTS